MVFHQKTKESLGAATAAFVVIALLGFLTNKLGVNLIAAPFGATCAIVFGMPAAPAARPQNILFGYIFASTTAYLLFNFFGYEYVLMALAVALSIFFMLRLGLLHPPAAGLPLVFYLSKPNAQYLLFPVLTGCVLIIVAAKLYNQYVKNN